MRDVQCQQWDSSTPGLAKEMLQTLVLTITFKSLQGIMEIRIDLRVISLRRVDKSLTVIHTLNSIRNIRRRDRTVRSLSLIGPVGLVKLD